MKLRLLAYGDEVIVRNVLRWEGGRPVICSDEELEAARREGRSPRGLAWPAEDVLGAVEEAP
jgi:hypothetical protein